LDESSLRNAGQQNRCFEIMRPTGLPEGTPCELISLAFFVKAREVFCIPLKKKTSNQVIKQGSGDVSARRRTRKQKPGAKRPEEKLFILVKKKSVNVPEKILKERNKNQKLPGFPTAVSGQGQALRTCCLCVYTHW
jgi:hypothetical protein